MSLEAALAAHTEALKANTVVMTEMKSLLAEGNKVRSDLLQSAAGAAAAGKPGRKPKDTATTTTTAATTTAPAAAAGTGSSPLDAILKEFGGKIDEAALRKEFGGYMGVTDEKEREKRKGNVVALLAEIGAAKATEIKDEDRPRAIYYLRKFAKGETVDFKADIADAPAAAKEEEAGDDLL